MKKGIKRRGIDRTREKKKNHRHNYCCLKNTRTVGGEQRAGEELRAGCATGRRTFKLMTFNAKLYCARRAWNEG